MFIVFVLYKQIVNKNFSYGIVNYNYLSTQLTWLTTITTKIYLLNKKTKNFLFINGGNKNEI